MYRFCAFIIKIRFKKDNAILGLYLIFIMNAQNLYIHTPEQQKKTYQITGLQMDVDNRSRIP